MLLPIGLEDSTVHRIPYVSAAFAAACFAVFIPTWILVDRSEDVAIKRLTELARYMEERPNVAMPPACKDVLGDRRSFMEDDDDEDRPHGGPPMRAADPVEQDHANSLCQSFLDSAGNKAFRKWGLVPSKGLAQKGLVTHLFLHAGWLHILFNLFFLYLCAPFLEDVWSRRFFLPFLLLAGAFSGVAQYALSPGSTVPIVGASGAVAACMGAFSSRFAQRRVKMLFWSGIIIRTFYLPAWAFGGLWFARELADLVWSGSSSGVALASHVGGFLAGLATALAVHWSGYEKNVLSLRVEGLEPAAPIHPVLKEALGHKEKKKWMLARGAYRKYTEEFPQATEGWWGSVECALQQKDIPGAHRDVERLVALLLAKKDDEGLLQLLGEFGPSLDPSRVKPATSLALGRALLAVAPGDAAVWLAAAADSGDPRGDDDAQEALITLGEMELENIRDAQRARTTAQRALNRPVLTPQRRERAQALLARTKDLSSGIELSMPAPQPSMELDLSTDDGGVDENGRPAWMASASEFVSHAPSAGVGVPETWAPPAAAAAPQWPPAAPAWPPPAATAPAPVPAWPPPAAAAPAPVPAWPAPAATAPAPPAPWAAPAPSPFQASGAVAPPTFTVCKLVGRDGATFRVEPIGGVGGAMALDPAALAAFRMALVASMPAAAGSTRANILVMDLEHHAAPGQPRRVLRLASDQLGLSTVAVPGLSPKDAWRAWVQDVITRSGLPAPAGFPDGGYPRFGDLIQLEAAWYAAPSAAANTSGFDLF